MFASGVDVSVNMKLWRLVSDLHMRDTILLAAVDSESVFLFILDFSV